MKILTKENSQILRGLAILSIMMHNFLHREIWGLSGENEMSFVQEKANAFFDALMLRQTDFLGVCCELFSFVGWIGVPVFVFLTGYGVALSGRELQSEFDAGKRVLNHNQSFYIKRQWLKLFVLMLPAMAFFALVDFLQKDFSPVLLIKRGFYLTQLANFVYPFVKCTPGVYWYFGLTFQFYLLWALFGKKQKSWTLLIISIITMLGLYFTCRFAPSDILSIYRHCFTGWFEVFAFGLFFAQNKACNEKVQLAWYWELLLLPFLICLVILLNIRLELWLFLPITALVTFFCLASLLMRVKYVSSLFKWIGRLSACIFVCHPIARLLVVQLMYKKFSLAVIVLVYVVLTFILAMVYKKVYEYLLSLADKYFLKQQQ